MSKGVKGAAETFEYGLDWLTARRARIRVFEDRVECGDWVVPYEKVSDAVLFETRSGIFRCFILRLRTSEHTYQFGLNHHAFWRAELPFEVIREKGKLKVSLFSLLIRGSLFVVFLWYLYNAISS